MMIVGGTRAISLAMSATCLSQDGLGQTWDKLGQTNSERENVERKMKA